MFFLKQFYTKHTHTQRVSIPFRQTGHITIIKHLSHVQYVCWC